MYCYICGKSLKDTPIEEYLPLKHDGKTVYVHTHHIGVTEEYKRQQTNKE